MAYADKCCGCCNEYQELNQETEKRFAIANVCANCIQNQLLNPICLNELQYSRSLDIYRWKTSYDWAFWKDVGNRWWEANTGNGGKWRKLRYMERIKHAQPYLYQISTTEVNSMGRVIALMNKEILIYSKDKRKLRKALRKLGVSGKIESLIV